MTQTTNAIFTLVSNSFRRELFDQLIQSKIPVYAKTSNDQIYTLQPTSIEKEKNLICDCVGLPTPDSTESLVISFTVSNEKYFMQVAVSSAGDEKQKMIDGGAAVYKLQRRQAYRIVVPATYRSKVLILNEYEAKPMAAGTLTDISSGGCRVILEGRSELKGGDVKVFDIVIGRRDPLKVMGEIRHVQKIESPRQQEALGIMFKALNSVAESKLFAITLELHRELASKVNTA